MYYEINFDDLKENVQKEILELMKLEKPEDGNLDIVPLTVIEIND